MDVKKRNIIFALFCCIAFLIIAVSNLTHTKRSKTKARLVLIEKVLANCRDKKGESYDKTGCLYEYGRSNGFPEQNRLSWAIDGYGSFPILDQSVACKSIAFCAIYSKGKNGVDECGKGDDVSLHSC
jgi:hypothetical protein